MNPFMRARYEELPKCEACIEPITENRPGYHWLCRNADESVFPYHGEQYSTILHDERECEHAYMAGVVAEAERDNEVKL